MRSRRIALAMVMVGLLAAVAPPAVAATSLPLPTSMAAVGDSITQAASSAGSLGVDAPQNSWSTGTNTSVLSHAQRLQALGATMTVANRSVSGAKMADLEGQMTTVVALRPDYLTVLIGGNDLCTDTVDQMTSVADFQAQFQAALATLSAGSPDTHVLVASVPDAYRLWDLFKSNYWARLVWAAGDICQSLLANPGSNQAADVQRRATVRQRNIDYNAALASVCASTPDCLFDGNAVFDTAFARSDVSGDYFHPSVSGQAKIAAVTWAAGYAWASTPPPNEAPTAAFTSSCTDLDCAFNDGSTDSDGTIATRSWTFGDGGTAVTANPTHSYAAAGSYVVTLTVIDDDGASATTSATVTVSDPPVLDTVWVSALAATTTAVRSNWTATVAISVASADGLVAGATVTGSWTAGSGATSCVTATDGRCMLVSSTLNKKTTSVTFTVLDVTGVGLDYDAGASTATSTTIARP